MFLILATGGGKSAVYILVHRLTGKMVVVFEPLISIIQDQVLNCKRLGVTTCAVIAGATLPAEAKLAEQGKVGVLFMSPEALPGWKARLVSLAKANNIGLLAVDEVHTTALWQFRHLAFSQLAVLNTQPDLKTVPKLWTSGTVNLRVEQEVLLLLLLLLLLFIIGGGSNHEASRRLYRLSG